MKYAIHPENRPVYLQLYRQLRDDVVRGAFAHGEKLPSKRLLSEESGVSTITVEHAYALLCEEGYAEARERSGYYVVFQAADGFAAHALEPSDETRSAPLGAPSPSADYPSFSVSILSRTMRRVLTESPEVLLQKSPNAGCTELRRAIQQYLVRNRGIHVEMEQIIVGSGAEYLYRMLVDLLGRDRVYAIETPSYEKLEQIYRAAGAAVERLPLTADGIDSAALSASRADVLHTTPYRSFPSGVTASASKRHEYLRWASQPGRFLIESDYGSEFSVSSQPMETLFALSDQDNVVYLNTFSRTVSPSMRIGYMVLPRRLTAPFQEKLGFYSCCVPSFEQRVLAELLRSGDFERHINRVRRSMRRALSARHDGLTASPPKR